MGQSPQKRNMRRRPRGRVMYNAKTRQFTLLADRCILKKKALISQIKRAIAPTE